MTAPMAREGKAEHKRATLGREKKKTKRSERSDRAQWGQRARR